MFSCHILPIRYNSERLEIIVVIGVLLDILFFKDIKISLGRSITVRKMLALFRENHCLELSTTATRAFIAEAE